MEFDEVPFIDLLEKVVDNRGKTCPVVSSGIPLIATNCISNNHLYPTYETTRYVSNDTYQNWFRGHPVPGDILFVNKGSPGRVCWVPNPVDFCIAQDMVAIRANPNLVYPKYLFALLRSSSVQEKIANLHVGTLIPHFKKGDFGKLLLPILRNRAAQVEIGDTYFELSQKIEINSQINQTLEQMAQALFQSWFVDFEPVKAKIAARAEGRDPLRAAMCTLSGKTDAELDELPGEQFDQLAATAALFPEELVESELGEIPAGWGVGTLADLCGLNTKSWGEKTLPEQVNYVDLANTKNGVISEVQVFSAKTAPSRARRILRDGDTIIGTVRPGNRSFAMIGTSDVQLTGSTGFAVLSPKTADLREFVYLVATSELNFDRLTRLADGGAYPAVRPDVVTSEVCVVASPEIVMAFHQIIGPMFSQSLANLNIGETLATLRDSLLPRLLSGELSVAGEPTPARRGSPPLPEREGLRQMRDGALAEV